MIGILHFAYGAPQSLDDLTDYFSHVLNGKTPPPPMMANITNQFSRVGKADLIGGVTSRIASGLQQLLPTTRIYKGYRHTAPFIEDSVQQMLADGVTKIIVLPINPIFSQSGSGAVHAQVDTIVNGAVPVVHLNDWHLHPAIIALYANRVRRANNWLPQAAQQKAITFFTAHSQPLDTERNAPYIAQMEAMALAIAEAAALPAAQVAYRSAKERAKWLGPDVQEAIQTAVDNGHTGIITCELLSLAPDVESFFEIGADCQALCATLDIPFVQSEFPADSIDTVLALKEIITPHL